MHHFIPHASVDVGDGTKQTDNRSTVVKINEQCLMLMSTLEMR